MSNGWYPILFTPIFKQHEWGGILLRDYYGHASSAPDSSVGELYELVDHEEAQSVVENGEFQGKTINELLQWNPTEFIGSKSSHTQRFPLVFKFIDTGKRRPLQVHPDHIVAEQIQHSKPNSKMWYVIAAQPQAKILVGIKRNCTQQQFLGRVGKAEIDSVIQSFPSQTGDAYFVSAGRVHALDAGNLVFSIEQQSPSVYIIGDWGLTQVKNEVPKHEIELALRCIHFQDRTLARIRGESSLVDRNRKIPIVTTCPFFAIDDIRLVYELHDHTDGTSFHVLTAIDGGVTISTHKHSVEVARGRSCYIPAALGHYSIKPECASTRLLKTTLRVDSMLSKKGGTTRNKYSF